MLQSLRRAVGRRVWRWKARKKHCVGFHVTDVPRLLTRLEEQGVPAVALRWFDDVPRTPEEEARYTKDVDLLIDGSGLETAISLAAEQPGPVRCDVYSSTGQRGSTYKGMPYYPPVLAQLLLSNRKLYDSAFYVPQPEYHFRSLAYHLVYHKGLISGIPSGCHLQSEPQPKREYGRLLADVAKSARVKLDKPVTLLKLHEILKQHEWNMPLDLLARWPKQTPWHAWLLEREQESLKSWADTLPHLLVFFLREDITEKDLTETALQMLREKFHILHVQELSNEQTERVMRQVRGGNWLQHQKTTIVPPKVAVVCYDLHPDTEGVEQAATQTNRKNQNAFPFVKNANVFFKHEARRRLNEIARGGRKIQGIHGSDNAFESLHMVQAVYGKDSGRMIRDFARQLLGTNAGARQRPAA